MTEIAFDCDVSLPTVLRRLHQVHFSKPQHLPEVLSFDEFKCFNSEMAFNLFDAQTHQIIDIVPSRRLEVRYRYNPTFRYLTSERDIVHELLNYDASLKAYYESYQETLQAVSMRQPQRFRCLVERQQLLKSSLNENFKPVFQTFKKFEAFIDHSLTLPFSNGPIGSNNHIKVLKRIAYGYRNFTNFRNRILLVLVTAKNVQHNQEVIQNFTSDSQKKTREINSRISNSVFINTI